jgi:O-acetyl-ADP-ribose deacetylase
MDRRSASTNYDDDMPRIALLLGDITRQDVDAIVNAANSALRPGGGVDGAIARAAGVEARADRERLIRERGTPPLPTGHAVATIGGALAARWIIHTAGPIYSGTPDDARLLATCHASVLAIADELGLRTVAFPAISTGVYGYPVELAASVAIAAVRESLAPPVELVRFVLFSQGHLDAFRRALDDVPGEAVTR